MTQKFCISKEELISLIKKGYTAKKIAEFYGISPKTVSLRLKEHNIDIRAEKFNHNFFNKIDNQEKAYWLGFMMADGCVTIQKSTQCHRIELGLKDEDHIIKWHKAINSNNNIHHYKLNGKIYYNSCHVSKIMFADLVKHGCMPRKTFKLKFPQYLNNNLMSHFIRGYFDGDGCVGLGKNKNRQSQLIFSIMGLSKFLQNLSDKLPVPNNLTKIKNGYKSATTHKRICVHGNHKCKILYDWLYKDAVIFLDRKKTIVDYHFQQTMIGVKSPTKWENVEIFGEYKQLKEWAKDSRCIVKYKTLHDRISAGWDIKKAMTTPRRKGIYYNQYSKKKDL